MHTPHPTPPTQAPSRAVSALGALALVASLAACGSTAELQSGPAPAASADRAAPFIVTAAETTLRSPDTEGTLRLPVVSGEPVDVALRINEALSARALLESDLATIEAEFAECSCGIVGADFEVTWNEAPVLNIVVAIETMAAYPSGYEVALAFDTETGERLGVDHVFAASRRAGLAALVDAKLQVALADSMARADELDASDAKHLLEGGRFTEADLGGFFFREDGVAFSWEAELPRVIQVLEPEGPFVIGWAEVAPFLTPRYRPLAAR